MVIEGERADAVRIVGIGSGSPEGSADFAGSATGVAGVGETEIVRADDERAFVRGAVADASQFGSWLKSSERPSQ